MRMNSKQALLGVPVIMFVALVAVLAMWATGTVGGNGVGGNSSSTALGWNVEYWHRNADGDLLGHKKSHNAFTNNGLEIAMERLIKVGAGDLSDATTTTNLIVEDAFNKIVLLNVDDTSGDIDASAILQLVDGQGSPAIANPAVGTFSDGGADGLGDGSIAVTFTASGSATATQMQLVKAAPADTTSSGTLISASDVLAVIEIDVTLANTDTLTVTWTVDAD